MSGGLQGERDQATVSNMVLSELAPLINAQHAVFYVTDRDGNDDPILTLAASYAATEREYANPAAQPAKELS